MFKGIWSLLTVLPELLKLIKQLQEINKERKVKRKIKEDVQKINVAFEKQDAEMLKKIFNDEGEI